MIRYLFRWSRIPQSGTIIAGRRDSEVNQTARNRGILVMMILVVVVVTGIAIYRDRVAPFRRVVLEVGDATVRMSYLLKRSAWSDAAPRTMLQTLMYEQIITQVATEPPYDLDVTDQEIDRFLRDTATPGTGSLAADEYQEWYRQQVNDSRLSENEFRDMIRASLLRRQLASYLVRNTPELVEQVRLQMVTAGEMSVAQELARRLALGEELTDVLRSMGGAHTAQDASTDMGWFPRVALPREIARAAFDQLSVGEVSTPIPVDGERFAVIIVVDRDPARPLDEQTLETMGAVAVDEWLQQQIGSYHVEIHGLENGYDSETDAWARQQIRRLNM